VFPEDVFADYLHEEVRSAPRTRNFKICTGL
jgi:hypothetical protein